jgi:hypothetical protein
VKLVRGRFDGMHLAASLLAGLRFYHDGTVVTIVDATMERIIRGIEVGDAGDRQVQIGAPCLRRVPACVRACSARSPAAER